MPYMDKRKPRPWKNIKLDIENLENDLEIFFKIEWSPWVWGGVEFINHRKLFYIEASPGNENCMDMMKPNNLLREWSRTFIRRGRGFLVNLKILMKSPIILSINVFSVFKANFYENIFSEHHNLTFLVIFLNFWGANEEFSHGNAENAINWSQTNPNILF